VKLHEPWMDAKTEQRLLNATERVLLALSDGLWHQNLELDLVAGRALHSRISDLRRIGYRIVTRKDSSTIFTYKLLNVDRARRLLAQGR